MFTLCLGFVQTICGQLTACQASGSCYPRQTMYTIKEAALRAGVSIPVLRAWERRYGIVRPVRTPSGYRLYDEPSIERIRAMRRLVTEGWSASQAARHVETEGLPASQAALTDSSRATGARAGDDLVADFVDAAAALDERRVEALLDDLFASGSFERVIDDRLMPALRALGEAWVAGEVSVGGEHAASHAVLRRLSGSFEAAGGGPRDRPVLVGLPAGSRHEIGALAFATTLRRRGIGVIYFGADVPLESWIDGARTTKARALVIGVPTSTDIGRATDVARAATQIGGGLLVAVGGPAAAGLELPPSVVRLPDGMAASADAFETALAQPA